MNTPYVDQTARSPRYMMIVEPALLSLHLVLDPKEAVFKSASCSHNILTGVQYRKTGIHPHLESGPVLVYGRHRSCGRDNIIVAAGRSCIRS